MRDSQLHHKTKAWYHRFSRPRSKLIVELDVAAFPEHLTR
jgi:hypothetical protein